MSHCVASGWGGIIGCCRQVGSGGCILTMGLDWGFMESMHHTARTVGYSGEFCTRRSNGIHLARTSCTRRSNWIQTPSKVSRPHSLSSGPGLQTVSETCPPQEPSRILVSQPQPTFILVKRTRVKTEHGLHCKTVTPLNSSTGSHKGQPCNARERRK